MVPVPMRKSRAPRPFPHGGDSMPEGSRHPDEAPEDESIPPFTYAHGGGPPPAAHAELTPPPGGGTDRTDPTLAAASTDVTGVHTPGGSWDSLAENAEGLQGPPQPGQTLFG